MIKAFLQRYKSAKTPEEKARKQLFSIKLGKNDIAIDCGANVGEITAHLEKSGAKIYCFEPNPYAFEVLQQRFENKENVHCFQKGVGDKNQKMKLYMHENSGDDEVFWSTGSSLLDFKSNVLNDKYVEVEIIDLCEFINSLDDRVKILKLDVEGAECVILKKILNSNVLNKIDFAFVETHDDKIPELRKETDEIRDILEQRKITNINLNWT